MIRSAVFSIIVVCCLSTFGQGQARSNQPQRDSLLLDVLTRVVNAAGGSEQLVAVHDLTESGEITFHWGAGVKGPVTIRSLGANHFRMEADLPEGKSIWLVNDGDGNKKEADRKPVAISSDNAINLGNLTFPIAFVMAALTDAKTDISLVGIEKNGDRSVYRLRIRGQFGLSSKPRANLPVVKDLLVDALKFNIVSVEDRPFRTYDPGGKPSEKASRAIEYSDFRAVRGVFVPFSITTKLMGQPTLSIELNSAAFNSNLRLEDFQN